MKTNKECTENTKVSPVHILELTLYVKICTGTPKHTNVKQSGGANLFLDWRVEQGSAGGGGFFSI
jgi:hypothetical protein